MMKKIIPWLVALSMLAGALSGCGNTDTSVETSGSESAENDESGASSTGTAEEQSDADMFTARDYEIGYDESDSVLIQLNGDSASASSDSVEISGSTITITEEATYILTGTLDDGMIIVNAPDSAKLQLVFNGVSIHCETSAPLYILEADKVFVTLADGSENTLSGGETFTAIDDNNIDGAVFSKQDLTFNGSGTLTVSSPAGHGIVCKDDLVFTSGTYVIDSASHGLDANDSVRIANAAITINAGKDGVHAENSDDSSLGFVYLASGTLEIEAQGDGISAGAYMQINDGTFDIVAGGGSENASKQSSDSWGFFKGSPSGVSATTEDEDSSSSMKGLKATGTLLISDGTFTIDSADDAVHSNASITINGGTFEIATGDDGFHADETLTVTAGTISISESYEGLEALDLVISGGDINLTASDDGLNAAGGTDSSGTGGIRGDDSFGGNNAGQQEFSDDENNQNSQDKPDSQSAPDDQNIPDAPDGQSAPGGQNGDAPDGQGAPDGQNGSGAPGGQGAPGDQSSQTVLDGQQMQARQDNSEQSIQTKQDSTGSDSGQTRQGGRGGMGGMGGMSSSSNGSIEISGGTIYIQASGDGIDANGSLTISGGTITICGPTQGDTATLDYDTSGIITGGTFIGTGAASMAQTFSDSEQGVITVKVGNQSAGTTVTLTDQEGNTIISHTPELSYAIVIISTPDIVSGETYTLTVGSSSQEVEAD